MRDRDRAEDAAVAPAMSDLPLSPLTFLELSDRTRSAAMEVAWSVRRGHAHSDTFAELFTKRLAAFVELDDALEARYSK